MKRLSSRLAALERDDNTTAPTREESALLVTILARRDALMWPWRFQRNSRTSFTEIRRRQREYLAGQVGVAVKADGRSNWKSAHELRQRLIAAGMTAAVHSGGQVQSVFLTHRGESTARAMVGDRLHSFHGTGVFVLARLRLLSLGTSCRAVRESVLWNHDCVGCPNDWDDKNEMILPLLTCGIVAANSDTQGRACYTPVDGIAEPPEITAAVANDAAFEELYLTSFHDERTMLETLEPRDPHEIHIPLPASGWGWPCYFERTTDEE